jgi:hypothetical protein
MALLPQLLARTSEIANRAAAQRTYRGRKVAPRTERVPVVLARQCLDGPCSHEGLQTRHRHRFCCAMPADSPPPTSCYQDPQAFATLVAFSGCAASLLLVNKVIMHQAHMPSFVGTLQFAASSFVAMLVMLQGWAKPDKFTWRRVKPYILCARLTANTGAVSFSH